MSSLQIYQDILHYDLNDPRKLRQLVINEQKIHTWELKRDEYFKSAKILGIPLDACWSKKRFDIFLRLRKKKATIETEKQQTWDSSETDDSKTI